VTNSLTSTKLNAVDEINGFVLTSAIKRTPQGDCVELWLVTEQGPQVVVSEPQDHVAFANTNDKERIALFAKDHQVNIFDSHLKTFEQDDVVVLKCPKQRDYKQFIQRCEQHGITLFENDIKLTDRFLMERFVYGSVIAKRSRTLRVKPGEFRPTLSYVSFDIECDEDGRLFSIGCVSGGLGKVWVVDPENTYSSEDSQSLGYEYIPVKDERSLLADWCEYINAIDPDVLLGWNVKQFDCSVLEKRASELGLKLHIGRDGSAMQVRSGNSDQVWVEIVGRAVVDGIESLKTMTLFFDNFSLNNVSNELLGKEKLVHDADQLATIKLMFEHDKLKLAHYNYLDCQLVVEIAEHTQLLDFLVLRSCLTGLSVSRPGGSVAAFINTYLPHVHRAGYISPNRPSDGGLASPGGYVMTSQPGLYEHVVLLDFKSLYPSIIRTFLIDPVGLVEGLKHPEGSIPGFKDAQFSRDTHFLPAIIDHLWKQRDQAKADKDEPRSRAIKIIMNSFYGVLGSGGCPFYDTRLASSITLRGHEIMQATKKEIEAQGYKVIYGDTDSTFVWLEHCKSNEEAIEIGNKLAESVNQFWQQTIQSEFNTDCYLDMEFETHFKQFFMPTIRNSEQGSKKRYVGKTSPAFGEQLVFKGMESVRSDWTELAKSFQTELYQRIFNQQPVDNFIRNVVSDVLAGKRNSDLVYRKRLKKSVESYTKTRPPHVKAAAMANEHAVAQQKSPPYLAKTYIEYVITPTGPFPVELPHHIDYQHYVEKQLRPIADSILPHIGRSFSQLVTGQLQLF
jgi:DNA polymerase-2